MTISITTLKRQFILLDMRKSLIVLTLFLAMGIHIMAQEYIDVYQNGQLTGSLPVTDLDSICFSGTDAASRHIDFWSEGRLAGSYPVGTVDSIKVGHGEDGHPASLSQLARQLNGTWHGELSTVYFDWRGVKVEASGTTDMTFSLTDEGGRGGTGLEIDYQDGKQVYWMPFNWTFEEEGILRITYSDRRTMASDECLFSGDTLTLILTDATDGLETCRYQLRRVP